MFHCVLFVFARFLIWPSCWTVTSSGKQRLVMLAHSFTFSLGDATLSGARSITTSTDILDMEKILEGSLMQDVRSESLVLLAGH